MRHKDDIFGMWPNSLMQISLASSRRANYIQILNVALMTFLTLLSFMIPCNLLKDPQNKTQALLLTPSIHPFIHQLHCSFFTQFILIFFSIDVIR